MYTIYTELYLLYHATVFIKLLLIILSDTLFFTVYLLYVNVCMNMYVMLLSPAIIIIIKDGNLPLCAC